MNDTETKTAATNQYTHNSRQEVHPFIPVSAERILDVGCNTGAFGEGLKAQRDIVVWGVEPNEAAARQAAKILDNVVNDLFGAATAIPNNFFDVVVFNDVLEHLVDPWDALRIAQKKLRPDGCVVASLPNILNRENLMHMLFERDFKYENLGIRDRTHLRFFTQKSMRRLFEESGYSVQKITGINERWWSESILNRLAYRVFGKQLEETKYVQYAVMAIPL
ncbi:bifunctional 2-polyprenyl-6-hydroxyphenol methylase/3-demethylubiquinol 3-O-methyltransferase UbiG [Rhodoferax sp. PAMC 29310]|uniref:class I SAM-dependent methyltransferase n=1 Tax=Rhodoferax sp. PAMC 29310 TaxID=2822760 RepID=UPI001B330FA7|nr:class I SAM-dependent methyltransferase [Rhodoferax sp. PAMC 29310]